MVLQDVFSLGTITLPLYAQIVEQLLCSNQQEMALMQYDAMKVLEIGVDFNDKMQNLIRVDRAQN